MLYILIVFIFLKYDNKDEIKKEKLISFYISKKSFLFTIPDIWWEIWWGIKIIIKIIIINII